jgi:acyl carrier protein
VVGVEQIGVDDTFSELGGDSLMALQVASRVRDKFEINIPIRALFERSTIALLAAMVERPENPPIAEDAELVSFASGEEMEGEL